MKAVVSEPLRRAPPPLPFRFRANRPEAAPTLVAPFVELEDDLFAFENERRELEAKRFVRSAVGTADQLVA